MCFVNYVKISIYSVNKDDGETQVGSKNPSTEGEEG